MSVAVWIAFSVLAASQVYMTYRFVKNRDAFSVKCTLSAFIAFTAYIILITAFNLNVPGIVIIFGMASLFTHTLFGYYLRLYERSKKFDRAAHALGSFAYALAAYCTVSAVFGAYGPKLSAAVFVWALGAALGVVVEITEFAVDSRRKTHKMLQKGLRDTNFDLVADIIGAAAAALYAYYFIF